MKSIWFDMDGTIADLYGVTDWLTAIRNCETRPYAEAKGIGNLATIARLLNKVQANGYTVNVISWTAKGGNTAYNKAVAETKKAWLGRHLKSVRWNEIKVVDYGTNKKEATNGYILFDDEEGNRKAWGENAYEPADIIKVLKALTR